MAVCVRTSDASEHAHMTRDRHEHGYVHRTFECHFAADVAGAVQAALAAEEIVSLDDVVAVLDEARIWPVLVADLACLAVTGWCVQALMAKLKISAAQRKKLDRCWRELSNRRGEL
jgi:hypothetical protein